jgi:hypothetical protein
MTDKYTSWGHKWVVDCDGDVNLELEFHDGPEDIYLTQDDMVGSWSCSWRTTRPARRTTPTRGG